MTLAIARTVAELRSTVEDWQKNADTIIGVVPTMGALHAGHLSLIDAARKTTNRIIVTILVNPRQFDDATDLGDYPRTEEEDIAKLEIAEIDLLFAPDAQEMY